MLKHFPRLTTIALSYVAAFLVFSFLGSGFFSSLISPLGVLGIFIAGAMYTYSFTSSIGAILLIPLALHYPAGLIAVVGGTGALLADLTIFKLIRHDLNKEVRRIGASHFMRRIGAAPLFRENWFRDIFGAVVLASPIPDEIGVAIMASSEMDAGFFILLTFVVDMLGIWALVSAVPFLF